MPVTAEKIVNDATDNLTAPAANVAAEKVKDGASQKSNEKRARDSKKAKEQIRKQYGRKTSNDKSKSKTR